MSLLIILSRDSASTGPLRSLLTFVPAGDIDRIAITTTYCTVHSGSDMIFFGYINGIYKVSPPYVR